jgi:hypothetical protein
MGKSANVFNELEQPAWRDPSVLAAANIVPTTGLATDYLNVFNEAIMLFGLLSEMPDMMDELRAWQPLTYTQHFVRSGFMAKELAILAYENADPSIKIPFDALSLETANLLAQSIRAAQELLGDHNQLAAFIQHTNPALKVMIETLDGMIHGGHVGGAQDDIDALFD